MRTLVDIPDTQFHDLTAICQAEKSSRAEAIRQAIALYMKSISREPLTPSVCGKIGKSTD